MAGTKKTNQKKFALWTEKAAVKAATNYTFLKVDNTKTTTTHVVVNDNIFNTLCRWRDGKQGDDETPPLMYIFNDAGGNPVRIASPNEKSIRDALSQSTYSQDDIDDMISSAISYDNLDEKVMLKEIAERKQNTAEQKHPLPLDVLLYTGDPKAFRAAEVHIPDGTIKVMRRDKNDKSDQSKRTRTDFRAQLKTVLNALNKYMSTSDKRKTKSKTTGRRYINIDGLQEDGTGAKVNGGGGATRLSQYEIDGVRGYYPIVASSTDKLDLARSLIEDIPLDFWQEEADVELLLTNLDKLKAEFLAAPVRGVSRSRGGAKGKVSKRKDESDHEQDEEEKPRKTRTRKTTTVKSDDDQDQDQEEEQEEKPKSRRGRGRPAQSQTKSKSKSQAQDDESDDDHEHEQEEEEKPKATRSRRSERSESPVARNTSPVRKRRGRG